MHFKSLLTVYLPTITPDLEWEKEVTDKIVLAQSMSQEKSKYSFMRNIFLEEIRNIATTFGRELTPVIRQTMERFNCYTEDKRYLEFDDRTDEYLEQYDETTICIKFPDGRIVEERTRLVWDKFSVKDGLVYEKYAGPLRHPKRTKKAKKMKVLLDYPRKKLYKSFDEFVEDYCGGIRNEKTEKYGEWYNPNGVYDWYSIGGRWPEMFLVKIDCTEYSAGERRMFNESEYKAPEGYRWVACARKKDVQWDVMRQWRNEKATERFRKLEAMFKSGTIDETVHAINENGILIWGKLVYRKDETLEEFLSEYGIPDNWQYPLNVGDIFNEDEHFCEHDHAVFDEATKTWNMTGWHEILDAYIENADEEVVFVGIDYHM